MFDKFTYINISNNVVPSFFIKKTDCWIIDSNDNFNNLDTFNKYVNIFNILEKKGIYSAVITSNLEIIKNYTPDFVFIKTSTCLNIKYILENCIIFGAKTIIIEDNPLPENLKKELIDCNHSLQFISIFNFEDNCNEVFINGVSNIKNCNSILKNTLDIPISFGETSLGFDDNNNFLSKGLLQNIRNMLLHKVINKKQSRFFYMLNLTNTGLFERAIVPIDTPVIEYKEDIFKINIRAEEREDNDGVIPKLLPNEGIACIFKVSDYYLSDRISEYLVSDIFYNSLYKLLKDFGANTDILLKKGQDIYFDNKKLYNGETFVDSYREHGTAGVSFLHINVSNEKKLWEKYGVTACHDFIGITDICKNITMTDIKKYIFNEINNTMNHYC